MMKMAVKKMSVSTTSGEASDVSGPETKRCENILRTLDETRQKKAAEKCDETMVSAMSQKRKWGGKV